ncbi:prepilin-type N-terminal cleavage/methylation domain-containing protein [Acinetobacter pseudolwoffii]|uniref:GspH/FimT family pseudopilin n=1 Tax=Acinetobacter TaxID=469 RepID=UPI001C45422A|nr:MULTISPECIES: prepilin-type N-terminal cleavage/methylation domain-containing protein [Acinetobacter]MDM1345335.1 prepilin-type N-terminal cleavage/methylation domain-containing protein [Acinetobacter pseudolwoffii]
MVSFKLKERGVSLMELMITITILAILVVTGTSLTALWSKQAELDKATMSLKSAMSLARSTAIRNEFSQNSDDAASQICFDQNKNELSVHKATATESASCTTTVVFSYPLSSTIEIKNANNTDFKCFSFNSFGQITTEITGNCKTNLSLTISNGSLNETNNLI